MKRRLFLVGMLAGVVLTALMALCALHGNNENWKLDAYKHYAAAHRFNEFNKTVRWQWLDDYFVEELRKSAPQSTPKPSVDRL